MVRGEITRHAPVCCMLAIIRRFPKRFALGPAQQVLRAALSPTSLPSGAARRSCHRLRGRRPYRRGRQNGPQPSGAGPKRPPAASGTSARAQALNFGDWIAGVRFSRRRRRI